jgi:Flp pilus assembly pilin Flp
MLHRPRTPASDAGPSLGLLRRLRRDERGVALTELALVLPLLLILVLGIIDFGKAINYWLDETHLANEASRWAAVNNWPGKDSGTSLQQYVLDHLDTAELSGDVVGTQGTAHSAQVCISFPDGTSNVGDPVAISVKYHYKWLSYLTNKADIGPRTWVTGKSTMRIEANLSADDNPYSAGCLPA